MNQIMNLVLTSIVYALPLLSLLFIILAMKKSSLNYALAGLWCSLIAIIIHYQLAGDEIFGNYFNYYHAGLYTINSILFISCGIYVASLLKSNINNKNTAGFVTLFGALIVTAIIVLTTNVWINAFFITSKYKNTPILQIARIKQFDFCPHSYTLFKISPDGSVKYLCPNGYGLLPAIGKLNIVPTYIKASIPVSTTHELSNKNPLWKEDKR